MTEKEFDDFYSAAFGRITSQIYAMIGNRDEAQECVQEAFSKAWAQRRRLDRAEHPEAWVRTTAYRLAVSRWRRTKLAARVRDRSIALPVTAAAPNENHVAVVEALRRLPEAQRRALVLHHMCDLPVEEVARETGAPAGTVKARLSRGRTALQALLTTDQNLTEGASGV